MACKCGSSRLLSISGRTGDECYVLYSNTGRLENNGYVPLGLGIGGGDYLEFDVCVDCGTLQTNFPISEETIQQALKQR